MFAGAPPAAHPGTVETPASAEVKSILSNICVVENTDVKVICSITTRKLKESI